MPETEVDTKVLICPKCAMGMLRATHFTIVRTGEEGVVIQCAATDCQANVLSIVTEPHRIAWEGPS